MCYIYKLLLSENVLAFRLSTKTHCSMDLSFYPMDTQTCELIFESCKLFYFFLQSHKYATGCLFCVSMIKEKLTFSGIIVCKKYWIYILDAFTTNEMDISWHHVPEVRGDLLSLDGYELVKITTLTRMKPSLIGSNLILLFLYIYP